MLAYAYVRLRLRTSTPTRGERDVHSRALSTSRPFNLGAKPRSRDTFQPGRGHRARAIPTAPSDPTGVREPRRGAELPLLAPCSHGHARTSRALAHPSEKDRWSHFVLDDGSGNPRRGFADRLMTTASDACFHISRTIRSSVRFDRSASGFARQRANQRVGILHGNGRT